MNKTSIGERIKQRRKEKGLTQTQIKAQTGISSGNLSNLENGNKLPSTPALIALSTILECSIDWLLTGEVYDNRERNLSKEREQKLLNRFKKLPEKDKKEIEQLIDWKLNNIQEEAILSNSITTETGETRTG